MDKYGQLGDALKSFAGTTNMNITPAKVKEVFEETCTVVVGDTLELTGVRLKSTINEAEHKIILKPKVGTYVLVGSLTGDERDLCVLKWDEIEYVIYEHDGGHVLIDGKDGNMQMAAQGVEINWDGNGDKVEIKNATISLKDVMEAIKKIFDELGLYTASGPTSGLLPPTMANVAKFEGLYKGLLK